ncbi:hypothetical protein MTO96_020580 [Rhipicephalus appendiculatus]
MGRRSAVRGRPFNWKLAPVEDVYKRLLAAIAAGLVPTDGDRDDDDAGHHLTLSPRPSSARVHGKREIPGRGGSASPHREIPSQFWHSCRSAIGGPAVILQRVSCPRYIAKTGQRHSRCSGNAIGGPRIRERRRDSALSGGAVPDPIGSRIAAARPFIYELFELHRSRMYHLVTVLACAGGVNH